MVDQTGDEKQNNGFQNCPYFNIERSVFEITWLVEFHFEATSPDMHPLTLTLTHTHTHTVQLLYF